MSTTKKLSRELEQMAATGDTFCNVITHEDVLLAMAAEARALEERVEELEAKHKSHQNGGVYALQGAFHDSYENGYDAGYQEGLLDETFNPATHAVVIAATARAEAAEAQVAKLRETERKFGTMMHALMGEKEAAEDEVARLRACLKEAGASTISWRDRAQAKELENHTLRSKLEKVRAEVKMGLTKLKGGTAHNHYAWILRHIDGEGSDE